MSSSPTIVLASGSPRRHQLLKQLFADFVIDPSTYEEDMTLALPPLELAKTLSLGKAQNVAARHPKSIIIGADTFVVYHNQVLGKPHTPTKALKMLQLLNGSQHSVVTGYTVLDTATAKTFSQALETKVYFNTVTSGQLTDYIKTGEPLEMAGAYAIQHQGKFLLAKYVGDYTTILGLPLTALAHTLQDFGLQPHDPQTF